MTSAPLPPVPPSDVPPSGGQPSSGGSSVRPQLRRSGTDRIIGGVCGGLADYSRIDPLLWRVGFVGLTLAGGSGVIIYLFLWVLTPSDPLPADTSPSPLEQLVQRLNQAITGALSSVRRD